MKLAEYNNKFETNMKVKSQNFGIGNASKIIGILRNYMYEHKIRTLTQEYLSNARDAMREAKTSRRCVVTVPNQMNPVFKVRDFGPGITPQRMENVFILYGESTKEDTNEQTGGFGVGSKSAWSYTDSFVVISITGGMKRTYSCHTGTTNEGRLDELSVEPTTEPTGVEIQIAVKSGDIYEFRNAIWRACHFWKVEEYPEFKGVVAHEVPPRKEGIRIGELELTTNIPSYLGLDTNHYDDYVSLVIDGIPYKMDKQFIRSCEELKKLLECIKCEALIHVGNGVMDIPATRESISNTDINKEVLNKIAPKLLKGLEKHIKEEFAKAKTYAEWIAKYVSLDKMLDVDEHAKRGDYFITTDGAIPGVSSTSFDNFELVEVGPNYGRRSKGGFKRTEIRSLSLANLSHIFYADDQNETMVVQNRRVKEYIEKSGLRKVILLVPKEQFDMEPNKKLVAAGPTKETAAGSKIMYTPITNDAPIKKVTVTLADSEKAVQKVLKDFGGKPISTLPYTPIVRVPKARRDRSVEEFAIHKIYNGHKRPKSTTLARVQAASDKYLYIPYKDFNSYREEFVMMDEFVGNLGYTLCALAPKSVKMVQGQKEFKLYDSWRKSFKPDDKLVAQACYNKAKNISNMSILKKATNKAKDKKLLSMAETYESILKINSTCEIPKAILELVSKEVKEFEKDDAALTNLFKEKYSLIVKVCADVGRIDTAFANELVIYINAKA